MTALPMPPLPVGSTEQQLAAQYTYLFQMAQQLNLALDQVATGTAQISAGGGKSLHGAPQPDTEQQLQTLKSLIIKTADTVERRMDQLTAQLRGEYVAQSDFGSYVEQLNAYLEANPEALTQYYSFSSDLRAAADAVDAAFSAYKADTQGYIRTGIVSYDGSVPVYGVAVGQNLTVTEVDGETVVDPTDFRATFTARRLSFWQDGTEVAYVSDNQLYITGITVLGSLTVGQWRISPGSGLAFQWIGG